MASLADSMFGPVEALAGDMFGEGVVYTNPAGESVTDAKALIDIEDEMTRPVNDGSGVRFVRVKSFGLRRSVVPEVQIFGLIRIVAEGANAIRWPVARITGSDADRWYVECERNESHERSRANYRNT